MFVSKPLLCPSEQEDDERNGWWWWSRRGKIKTTTKRMVKKNQPSPSPCSAFTYRSSTWQARKESLDHCEGGDLNVIEGMSSNRVSKRWTYWPKPSTLVDFFVA